MKQWPRHGADWRTRSKTFKVADSKMFFDCEMNYRFKRKFKQEGKKRKENQTSPGI
jgi:cytidylate kinase